MITHLILNLEAPLISFGGVVVDNLGVTREFPSVSMITGLFANAMGWRRQDKLKHQFLQDRLVFAARIDRPPHNWAVLKDFQTVAISNKDEGWTTLGAVEGRAGGTYVNHLRFRDYYVDMGVTLAIRLEQAEKAPMLDELASALQEPSRPIFIGRKACLPSAYLFGGYCEGDTALSALLSVPLSCEAENEPFIKVMYPQHEGVSQVSSMHEYMLTDQRDWFTRLHGGGRLVYQANVPTELFQRELVKDK